MTAGAPGLAAEAKAAVLTRHKEEWDMPRQLIEQAVADGDLDKAKLAKLTAENIKIRQEGERKAWGIMDKVEYAGPLQTLAEVALSPALRALIDRAAGQEDGQ
jgi:hypothetical protein